MAGAACHENFGSMLLQFIHAAQSLCYASVKPAILFSIELCILSPEKDDTLETETCK